MNKKIRNLSGQKYDIVNKEIGEIENLNECFITVTELLEDDEKIVDNSILFQNNITFVKSYRGNGVLLNSKLTNTEIAALIFISDFICYEDCVLRVGGNRKGKALTVKDLAQYRGVSYEAYRKVIKSLKDKQVIGFHSTGNDSINKDIK